MTYMIFTNAYVIVAKDLTRDELDVAFRKALHEYLLEELNVVKVEPVDVGFTFGESDDGWIEWNGGEQPVPDDTLVDIELRNDGRTTVRAHHLDWCHSGAKADTDIIKYRVVK